MPISVWCVCCRMLTPLILPDRGGVSMAAPGTMTSTTSRALRAFWKLNGAQIEPASNLRRGAMKIQLPSLLSLICAAFGLSLPEIPNLPDLAGFAENSVHGNFTAQTVEEPQEFLPTIAQIRAMTDQERAERFHWFLCVFLLVFLCVVISGTVIMMVGAELKALGSYHALGQTTPLSKGAQLRLVMLSFGGTVLLSFAACLWSLETGRLSKTLGLDWEVYLLLFCCAGASLLIQAVLAVAWLKAGDRFDAAAFAMASFSSMAPFLSDQFDTLRDIIFGGLCLQSQHVFMKIVGVLSWSYLLAFHAWFFYVARYPSSVSHTIISSQTRYGMVWYSYGKKEYVDPNPDAPGANCFNELATSHLAVLLIAPKVQGEWSGGGSFFVAAFNLVVPVVQIALAELLFEPVRAAAIPALGKRLNRAMKSGNSVAAKALWEEAEIMDDMQLFALFLPHLTFFLDVAKRCGFMSEELKDLDKLKDAQLETLQHMAAVFAGQAYCNLRERKIGNSSAKVVAEALKTTTTETLYLHDNEIGDEGAEALAESLKSNGSLKCLLLDWNNIGDRGAEALAESLKSNGSLEKLYLNSNKIADRGAEALAAGLMQNRTPVPGAARHLKRQRKSKRSGVTTLKSSGSETVKTGRLGHRNAGP
eukprot:s677_g27.t1